MKKLVKVEEVAGEGLIGLMGEEITIFCMNYIYAGKLTGVNDTCIKLDNAHVVFETGAFNDKGYKDAQKVAEELYIQTNSIESFGKTKKVL